MPLQDAGMLTLDDLIVCGASSIVEWTGLLKSSVVELCAYARHCKALDHINSWVSPEVDTDHSTDEHEDEEYADDEKHE